MNKGGFSFKRFIGVTRVKQNISRATGISFTKSGRERKIGHMITGGGCSIAFLMLLSLMLIFLVGCYGTEMQSPLTVTKVEDASYWTGISKEYPESKYIIMYRVYFDTRYNLSSYPYMETQTLYKVGDVLE